MNITIKLWWALPLVLIVGGWILASRYHRKNYQPGGYFGDPVTPIIALVIFALFALTGLGILIGSFL